MAQGMGPEDMQHAETRCRVFWLLQRLSSYSLWARKRDAWRAFAQAFETAVNTWPEDDPERMDADLLPRVLQTVGLYDRGVEQLGKGHRFVWLIGEPLAEALLNSDTVSSQLYRHSDYWERWSQLAPYPPKVEALNRLLLASRWQGDYAPVEVPDAPHLSAVFDDTGVLLDPQRYQYHFHRMPYPVFPETLPEVPPGTEIIIASGTSVPVDGIWEPITRQREKTLGLLPVGAGSIVNNGCFNYLVKGACAPAMMRTWDHAAPQLERVPTEWRLLWADERYRNGVVPDESEYFLSPREAGAASVETMALGTQCRTGEVCPVSGMWRAEGFDRPAHFVAAGDTFSALTAPVGGTGELREQWVTWHLVKRAEGTGVE